MKKSIFLCILFTILSANVNAQMISVTGGNLNLHGKNKGYIEVEAMTGVPDITSFSKVNILASWNFKHIVNENRIRGYNSVNLKLGYSQIEIRSPKDIIDYETGK